MRHQSNLREFYSGCLREKKYLLLIMTLPLALVAPVLSRRGQKGSGRARTTSPDAGEVAANFLNNMKCIEAICTSRGVAFHSILQPMNGTGDRPMTKEDKIIVRRYENAMLRDKYSRLDFFKEVFERIRSQSSWSGHFRDFSAVFDAREDQVFVDICHFSDKGQEIVAQSLFELVEKEHGV